MSPKHKRSPLASMMFLLHRWNNSWCELRVVILRAGPNPKSGCMDEFITPTVQVGQLFANPYFIEAPVYQRSFAWTEKEVCHLLDKVATAVDSAPGARDGSDYFLGTMLFIERDQRPTSRIAAWPRGRTSRLLDVVDGFQRLTTLTILFCVLRDMDARQRQPLHPRVAAAIASEQGASARQRLLLAGPDEAFFQAYVR